MILKFPKDLAQIVTSRWEGHVSGEYVRPKCPPSKLLTEILEICYASASVPEESRFPQFNIIVLPESEYRSEISDESLWEIQGDRNFSVSELTRIAPVVDIRKSALVVTWDGKLLRVRGILDLGTSWYRARVGLGYQYKNPRGLFVQVDRPGRLKVYQGAYHIASLVDGRIEGAEGISNNLFFHEPASRGLEFLNDRIEEPAFESPREYREFEFMALWNTYAAIANTISQAGHGGMIVLVRDDLIVDDALIRIKYRLGSRVLQQSFLEFINARHVLGDAFDLSEAGHWFPDEVNLKADAVLRLAYDELVDATRLVAGFSGCDGAIVMTESLEVIGFGAEVRADISSDVQIFEKNRDLSGDKRCAMSSNLACVIVQRSN